MNGRSVMLMNECQSGTAMCKRLNGRASAVAIALLFGISAPVLAAQGVDSTTMESPAPRIGEVIYVPVYSHIFQGDKASKQPLSSTLVIHNVDRSKPIQVTSVRYYDHSGAQIKEYTDEPLTLGPYASANFVVGIGEDRGGVGANFIVEWQADEALASPIVQAIMSGGTGTQGLSFVTQGKVIEIRR
jgi:hypothetical protein